VEIDQQTVVGWVRASGPWGVVVFVALVVGTNVVQVPAWIFVLAANVVWPLPLAAGVSYVACLLAATITFEVFGRAGGTALRGVDRPWVRKLLDKVDAQPVRGVAFLRATMLITPPITVALALAGVRRRDHFLGTAIGIIPLLAILLLLGDQLVSWTSLWFGDGASAP
jgi:uncharacterized membrane protein YdjX (TVP38/TMEM64 family)